MRSSSEGFFDSRMPARLLGALAGSIAYTVCVVAHLSTPRYFPVERTWDLGAHTGTVAMGYYGNLMVSAVALMVGYGIGRLPAASRFLNRPAPARVLGLLTPFLIGGCLALQLVYELVRWGGR